MFCDIIINSDNMKKIIIVMMVLFSFICVKGLEIESNNAILYNMNDKKIIYEKNAYDKEQIASLTKIVTAITYIENNKDLATYVTIKYDMLTGLNGYAKVGLRVGDRITKRELLYALMLPSAADAAQALAINNSGSIDAFVELMNKEVEKIGVKNTHFDNPVGMDSSNNYSTAYDMAQILIYALDNETFKEIFQTDQYYISSLNKNITKTVKDKERDYGIDTSLIKGAKTGYTDEAGLCLASTSHIDGVEYLLVTLGTPTDYPYHIKDAVDIYTFYSTYYGYINILNKDDFLVSIKIKDSKQKRYDVYSNIDVSKYLLKTTTKDDLIFVYDGINTITKKIKKGDKLGTVSIYNSEELLYTYDIYLDIDIKYYNYLLYGAMCIVVLLLGLICFKKLLKK